MFCLFHLGTPCYLENLVYSFNPSQECIKLSTVQECQLACQQTAGCSKFSYFTKYFKGSDDVKNNAKRESLDCCLRIDTKLANDDVMKLQYVISGPKYCPDRDATLSNSVDRDIFSGKENVYILNIFIQICLS